jgi:hypothetical protein
MSRNPSHRLEPVRPRSTAKRIAAIVGVIALVAVAFVGGLALAHKSSSPSSSAASSTSNGNGSSSTGAGSSSTGHSGDTTQAQGSNDNGKVAYTGGQVVSHKSSSSYAYEGDPTQAKAATGTLPPKTLPVVVSISSTKNLSNGQVIAIHAQPNGKSLIYGFEARLCAPKAVFHVEYDYYPTQTGNCVNQPLSSGTDYHGEVKANAPYLAADLDFRVGEGTNTYTDVDGKKVSITCDHDHPCQLVLLLQVPYGFGFQSFPLSFK